MDGNVTECEPEVGNCCKRAEELKVLEFEARCKLMAKSPSAVSTSTVQNND